jgi:hypothetical protein
MQVVFNTLLPAKKAQKDQYSCFYGGLREIKSWKIFVQSSR